MSLSSAIESVVNKYLGEYIDNLALSFDLDEDELRKTWEEVSNMDLKFTPNPVKKTGTTTSSSAKSKPAASKSASTASSSDSAAKTTNAAVSATHTPGACEYRYSKGVNNNMWCSTVPRGGNTYCGKHKKFAEAAAEDDKSEKSVKSEKASKKVKSEKMMPSPISKPPSKPKAATSPSASSSKSTPSSSKVASPSSASGKVIPKLVLTKNKHIDRFWDAKSKMVFKSSSELVVIGKCDENNKIHSLTPEDIETCKKYNFKYDVNSLGGEDSSSPEKKSEKKSEKKKEEDDDEEDVVSPVKKVTSVPKSIKRMIPEDAAKVQKSIDDCVNQTNFKSKSIENVLKALQKSVSDDEDEDELEEVEEEEEELEDVGGDEEEGDEEEEGDDDELEEEEFEEE